MRRYIPKLGAAIACSQAARRMMELQWQCPSSLIRLCYQPTRFGALSSGDAPTTLPSGRPVRIGFAGKLCFHKAPAVALHTLARLKQSGGLYELHVAGAGLELEGLQALARRLGLARDVVFHGLVRDMRPFFRSIHLLLCPSVCEPQGLVLAEAAGFGCPAVATLVDGIPETVVDGETGYCVRPELPVESYEDLGGQMGNPQQLPARCYDPSTDALVPVRLCRPEALAEAVSRLCADGARFRVLSAQARELAAQKFSASVYVDTLSRYLAESAGGR